MIEIPFERFGGYFWIIALHSKAHSKYWNGLCDILAAV